MTQNEMYFNQYPNSNLFLKVDSNYFLEENAMAAKIYSAQMGLPIEIIKREDLVELSKSVTEDITPVKNKNNKKH